MRRKAIIIDVFDGNMEGFSLIKDCNYIYKISNEIIGTIGNFEEVRSLNGYPLKYNGFISGRFYYPKSIVIPSQCAASNWWAFYKIKYLDDYNSNHQYDEELPF